MGSIQLKRGLSANLPQSAALAEILYTTDTKRVYVGNGAGQALTEILSYEELLETLNTLSEIGHTHNSNDITDFETAVEDCISTQKGVADGLATLGANGLIPASQIPANFKEAEVVPNILARNELSAFTGLHALVLDASDDPTVETGGAEYIYNGTTWLKTSELNDLDAIITWDNVTNKPYFVQNILDLSDTPSSFQNQAGKVLVVNDNETGLVFTNVYTGNVDGGTF